MEAGAAELELRGGLRRLSLCQLLHEGCDARRTASAVISRTKALEGSDSAFGFFLGWPSEDRKRKGAPQRGSHLAGDICFNQDFKPLGVSLWRCVAPGTPGGWEPVFELSGKPYTVATLPKPGPHLQGARAFVIDAQGPASLRRSSAAAPLFAPPFARARRGSRARVFPLEPGRSSGKQSRQPESSERILIGKSLSTFAEFALKRVPKRAKRFLEKNRPINNIWSASGLLQTRSKAFSPLLDRHVHRRCRRVFSPSAMSSD